MNTLLARLLATLLATLLTVGPALAQPAPACAGSWLGLTADEAFTGPGVRVGQVDAQGPAALAGLREGDLLQRLDGAPLGSATDLARWLARALPGETLVLALSRSGAAGTVTLQTWGVPAAVCQQRMAPVPSPAPSPTAVPGTLPAPGRADVQPAPGRADVQPAPGRADGLKAMVAVGAFQVKAAGAVQAIGDGLREMVISALHQSGQFVVVERADLRALSAEPELAAYVASRGGSSAVGLEVADIMVFGAVTEFEPRAGGSSWSTPIAGMPMLGIGTRISWSQMALDVRVVDVRTSRVLGAQRIPGVARAVQGTIGGTLMAGALGVPAGLSVYRGTPMEWAIRDCVHKAAYFVLNSLDDEYFRHR